MPSQPHTGAYSWVQADGRGLQTELASAAPQSPSGSYAQYSSSVQVSPSQPPQGPDPGGQAISVQPPHVPSSAQVQVLQPSSAVFVAPGVQLPSHSSSVLNGVQPSGTWQGEGYSQHRPEFGSWPYAMTATQATSAGSSLAGAHWGSPQYTSVQAHVPRSVQKQLLQPSSASFVSPSSHAGSGGQYTSVQTQAPS